MRWKSKNEKFTQVLIDGNVIRLNDRIESIGLYYIS